MSDSNVTERALRELTGVLSSVERKLDQLREEGVELRRTVEKLVTVSENILTVSENIQKSIQVMREDLSARLHFVSILMTLLDYVRVHSRLETLKGMEKRLKGKLNEVRELYRSKLREIIRDYLSAIGDFFIHFIRRSRGDLDLLANILSKDQVVREMYERLNPSHIDPEIVKLAVEHDTIERAKDMRSVYDILTEASKVLKDASMIEENFKDLLAKHEVQFPSDVVLFIPVIGVEVQHDGASLRRVHGPTQSVDATPELFMRAVNYAEEFLKAYPVKLDLKQKEKIKSLLLRLAESEDEKKLLLRLELVE